MRIWGSLGSIGAALIAITGVVSAQDSTNRVAAHTNWSVFEDTITVGGQESRSCWAVSAPKEQVNTREGRVVAVNRDPSYLIVFFSPSLGANGQVSVTGGYPYRQGSFVSVDINGTKFDLFTGKEDDPSTSVVETEMAWTASNSEDSKLVTAMKRGAEAVVVGTSSRGTTTQDTYSLFGFTAAVEDAETRCSS